MYATASHAHTHTFTFKRVGVSVAPLSLLISRSTSSNAAAAASRHPRYLRITTCGTFDGYMFLSWVSFRTGWGHIGSVYIAGKGDNSVAAGLPARFRGSAELGGVDEALEPPVHCGDADFPRRTRAESGPVTSEYATRCPR